MPLPSKTFRREEFSDIEEAEFFRTCGEHYGESAVDILSEKLSISDRYIRKRIEILKLPEAALNYGGPGLGTSGTWSSFCAWVMRLGLSWNSLKIIAVIPRIFRFGI